MMPPADWIYPGQGAKKDLTDIGDDFLAIGPALRIMQLNVEGLSAAKKAHDNNNKGSNVSTKIDKTFTGTLEEF